MRAAALLCFVFALPLQADDRKPVTIDDLMKVRNVLDPHISPDGSEVAYVVSVIDEDKGKYNSDLWLVTIKDKKTVQLTRRPGRDDTPRWSPDGKTIGYISDRSGTAQVWLLPRTGGDPRQATRHATPVTEFAWSADGKQIAFLAKDADTDEDKKRQQDRGDVHVIDRHQKNSHLHAVEITTNKSKRLTEGNFHVTSFSWSPDGKRIAYAAKPTPAFEDDKNSDIFLLTIADGKSKPLVKRKGADALPKFSPDGKSVAFLSRGGSDDPLDNMGLCVVAVEVGEPRSLSATHDGAILGAAESYEWGPDSETIYYTSSRATLRSLSKISTQPNAEVKAITPPTAIEDRLSLSSDGKRIAYLRENPASPNEVWFSEIGDNGGSPVRLTDTNPQLQKLALASVELMRYKSKDGLEIEGLLVKPVGYNPGQRYPTIAYIHGGPAGQFAQGFALYPSTIPQASRYPVQAMAGKGYVIFCPNPRGSGSYGAKFRKMNVRDWGGADFDDIIAGIDELINKGIADPDRLGIMGWSYGGFMTGWAITQTDRFKAASFGAGLTNLMSFYGQTDIPSFLERYWGGTPWEQKEIYEKHSAMTFIKNVRTPTLIQHGEKDERVPLAQSQELYAALKRRGVPVEMAVYPRQGHNVLEPRLQRDVLTRNLEWFERWLKK
jgi:dipeptidyl aminopeptidase/acylaminoacyl peptidase